MLEPVLATRPSGDPQLWVDCAYRSQEMVKALRKRGYQPRMGFQVKCGQTLNARQVSLNQAYSQARWRVEHVCSTMPNAMPEPVMRWIGKVRATGWMGMRRPEPTFYHRVTCIERVAVSGSVCTVV